MTQQLLWDSHFTINMQTSLQHGNVVHSTPLHSIKSKVGKSCLFAIYGGFITMSL